MIENSRVMPIMDQPLRLIPPQPRLESEYHAYVRAFLNAGERPPHLYELALEDFSAYLQKMAEAEQGIGIEPGGVSSSVYWLIDSGRTILGSSSFRHTLNPDLEDLGGNIGYKIHPMERRKGYGSLILKLTLEKARERGLSRVLVTCDADNIGSAAIIVKNGGILASQSYSETYQRVISRYWIDL